MASIRPAVVTDAEGIARVHVDTWQATYPGIMPAELIASMTYEKREKRTRERLADPENKSFEIVAVENGKVVAFASGGAVRKDQGMDYGGELYAVYVHPDHQRKGLGRKLTRAVAKELRERGYTAMMLWVLRGNPAEYFYEEMGGIVFCERDFLVGGYTLPHVGFGWKDITVLEKL